jgi:hypothetical protein
MYDAIWMQSFRIAAALVDEPAREMRGGSHV